MKHFAWAVWALGLLAAPAQIEAQEENRQAPLPGQETGVRQNYPNPFNPETTIRYQIGKRSPVRLEIYNLVGQRVRTLVHTTLEAGSYAAPWDGRNDEGVSVSSGVYMYRLRAGEFMATQKMLLIR